MKKINFIGFTLLLLLISVFIIRVYNVKKSNSSKFKVRKELSDKILKENNSVNLLTFIFQPSLNVNCEIIIDLKQRILAFKSIYPESILENEPKMTEEINEYDRPINPESYVTKLSENQIKNITAIINRLENKDFERIDKEYIDGISYNFSLIYNNNSIRTGNIAAEKTLNQSQLVKSILNLISETNQSAENSKILKYYYNFQ